jgi:hypothetical protein
MSKGFRLRAVFSVLAVGVASLALAGGASASDGDGVVIQSRDACDHATFTANGIPCDRTDNSGGAVTFQELLDTVGKKHSHPAWRFTKDDLTVKAGTPVVAEFGRGGELHTFSKVSAFGPGCIPLVNDLVFGMPAPSPPSVCDAINAGAGVPQVFLDDGLFPGRQIAVDTSTPGTTQFFQCLIHPWMRTSVTVE